MYSSPNRTNMRVKPRRFKKKHFLLANVQRLWPPLWSRGQNSWLQIQRSWFDSRRYEIFREVVVLDRSPFSLVSTIEELLWRNYSVSVEIREYGRGDPSRWPRNTLYPQNVATKFTDKRRSLGRYSSLARLVFVAQRLWKTGLQWHRPPSELLIGGGSTKENIKIRFTVESCAN
jgi:hypothetical protein